jgi:putative tryptophan/tyrosine transport system ATP-binding protein
MIELQHISKAYNAATPLEVKALKDISLILRPSTFSILIGANGSGKSTLLNVIAGSEVPDKGHIIFNGEDTTNQQVHERSKRVARIFQNPTIGTAPDLSLLENFRLASIRTRKKGLELGISAAFRKVVASHISILDMGLENRLDQKMSSFSGGQRQALSLLMATFDNLDLLLLDEPTAALDPKSAELVFDLTLRIVREKNLCALMVSHDLKHCLKPIDRIIQMAQGSIVKDVLTSAEGKIELSNIYSWFN